MSLLWHSCRIASKPEIVDSGCKHTSVSGMTVYYTHACACTYPSDCCSQVCNTNATCLGATEFISWPSQAVVTGDWFSQCCLFLQANAGGTTS
jgi:hypothetical protein